MKKIALVLICGMGMVYAEVTATIINRPNIRPPKPEHPIIRPPIRPIRPIVQPVFVQEDYNYYTNVVNSCDEYIRIIEEKEEEIFALKKEIESLKNKENRKLQQNLKTEYEQALKKFDERKSGLKTKNSIDLSDK